MTTKSIDAPYSGNYDAAAAWAVENNVKQGEAREMIPRFSLFYNSQNLCRRKQYEGSLSG